MEVWKDIKIGSEELMTVYYSHQNGVEILLFCLYFHHVAYFLALYSVNRELPSLLFFRLLV